MRVLVACEFSQVVCKAFRKRGHEAYSCDIIPCEGGHPEWHFECDLMDVMSTGIWDLMIAHPPCTFISYAGTQVWNKKGRVYQRLDALKFFADIWEADIPRICIENPKSCASPVIAKYSQVIQPYQFGDNEMKTTWLWLKNLPLLIPTTPEAKKPKPLSIDNTEKAHRRYITDGKRRKGHERSLTFPGIAAAMAEQWGEYE